MMAAMFVRIGVFVIREVSGLVILGRKTTDNKVCILRKVFLGQQSTINRGV